MSVIRAEALSKRFRSTHVLNGVDLDVPEGAIYALLGPNGAGKTTTIKVLMNITPPSSGRSEVLGVDSRRLSPKEFARIGYVSENQEMPEWMTVGYYLEFLRPFYPTWDRKLEEEFVRQFDLPRDRKLRHLSRGMRMKAALASSLAYRPKLVVLDEPFTGLDALVRDELIGGLLARAENTTIFISSHDLADIESFASHIGFLDGGRLQTSEELESLSNRFREIALTFDESPPLPEQWPENWLRAESSGAVVRFIDQRFDPERTPEQLQGAFPGIREIEMNAMPLRSIFVALAQNYRIKQRQPEQAPVVRVV